MRLPNAEVLQHTARYLEQELGKPRSPAQTTFNVLAEDYWDLYTVLLR